MAELSVQDVDISGLEPSFTAASSGGDSAPNSGSMFLVAKNTSAADETVQPDDTATTKYGTDVDPPAVTVPAGSRKYIGPFPREDFSGTAQWTYSDNTAFEVAAVRLTGVNPS